MYLPYSNTKLKRTQHRKMYVKKCFMCSDMNAFCWFVWYRKTNCQRLNSSLILSIYFFSVFWIKWVRCIRQTWSKASAVKSLLREMRMSIDAKMQNSLSQGRHMGWNRQDLGLTLTLKNRRWQQQQRAAFTGVLSSLGTCAGAPVPY